MHMKIYTVIARGRPTVAKACGRESTPAPNSDLKNIVLELSVPVRGSLEDPPFDCDVEHRMASRKIGQRATGGGAKSEVSEILVTTTMVYPKKNLQSK